MTFQSTVKQMAVFTFMALVTSGVLALLILELAKGFQGLVAILVYGVTASFGIEFLVASWPTLWRGSERPS
jgi:predicted membrane channel-forming protein YqfA (hemolysin III family)